MVVPSHGGSVTLDHTSKQADTLQDSLTPTTFYISGKYSLHASPKKLLFIANGDHHRKPQWTQRREVRKPSCCKVTTAGGVLWTSVGVQASRLPAGGSLALTMKDTENSPPASSGRKREADASKYTQFALLNRPAMMDRTTSHSLPHDM